MGSLPNKILQARLRFCALVRSIIRFSPDRGPGEQNGDVYAACTAAVNRYDGFFGPFIETRDLAKATEAD